MNEEELIKFLQDGLSTRKIAEIKGVGYSTVARWVRKFGLQSYYEWNRIQEHNTKLGTARFLCRICGKSSEKGLCQGCNTKIRRYRSKVLAIDLKGGVCNRCGWSGNIAAFEFHHMESEEKDFTISNVANRAWEIIEIELNKCELLCSNCHRIEHSNNEGDKFLNEVYSYQGQQERMIARFGNK